MWKKWCTKGRKEKCKDDNEDETNMTKVDDIAKEKGIGRGKRKDGKKKET
jgi:hypothetical protein